MNHQEAFQETLTAKKRLHWESDWGKISLFVQQGGPERVWPTKAEKTGQPNHILTRGESVVHFHEIVPFCL